MTENSLNSSSETIIPFLNSFDDAVTYMNSLGKHDHVFQARVVPFAYYVSVIKIYKSLNRGLNQHLTEMAEGAILDADIDIYESRR